MVRSLEAVLWAFYHTQSFKDGCLKVGVFRCVAIPSLHECIPCLVNLGNDADTVGAIYGQLAGAYYGDDAIPKSWRSKCSLTPLIEVFATELFHLADSMPEPDISAYSATDWSATHNPLVLDKCKHAIRLQYMLDLLLFHTVSDIYSKQKLGGYDFLESRNKEVVRKLNPCPRAYKT